MNSLRSPLEHRSHRSQGFLGGGHGHTRRKLSMGGLTQNTQMAKGATKRFNADSRRYWACRATEEVVAQIDCFNCRSQTCHKCGQLVEQAWYVYCIECVRDRSLKMHAPRHLTDL